MAETIKIFELDIDVDGAIKESERLKNETTQLKEEMKKLKDAGEENTAEFVQVEAQYKNLNREYGASQRQLGNLINLQGKNIETVQEARSALSVVNREWANQASLYGANSEEADKLAKKKLELTERLKTLEKSTGDTSRNVGNYTESMKDAIKESGLWQKAQSAVNDVTSAAGPIITFFTAGVNETASSYKKAAAEAKVYTGAKRAMAIATNLGTTALKLFKVALISTGIGAILVLIGSLVSWFSRTQEGIDFVNKALEQLSAAFDVVADRAANMGEGLMNIFRGNFREGFNQLSEATKGFGDEMARSVRLVGDLQDATNQLRQDEMDLIQVQAARKKQVEELRILAKDEETSLEERAKLLQQAGDIEEQILADNLKIAKEKARISQLDTDRAISTDEELRANEELQARVIEMETESIRRRRSIETEKQSLLKRARAEETAAHNARQAEIAAEQKARQDAARAATDAALKESNLRLQIYVEENKGRTRTLQEGLEYEKEVSDRRMEILESELEHGKVSQTEYELEKLKIKNESLAAQTALTQAHAQKEIEAEKERLAARQELEAQEKERKATDLENRMIAEEENFLVWMELERQRLEMQRQLELEEAEKTGADVAAINRKYAKINEDIDYELQMAKRDHAQNTFGQIAELLGEQTAAGKAAAVAQATINTYQGITEVWRSPSVLPEPFATIQKLVSTGTVLASGLGAVRKIASTSTNVPKAAKGMTLEGPSHGAGGMKLYDQFGNPIVEAEGGENVVVINKRASGLMNSLSHLNQSTGGVPLSQRTNYAAAGGMLRTSPVIRGGNSQQAIDYDKLGMAVAQANLNLPAPRVSVEEINRGQTESVRVINGAII